MSQKGYHLLSPSASGKKGSNGVSTHYSVLEDGESSAKADQTGRCPASRKKYVAVAFAFILLATVVVVATVLTTGSDYMTTSRRAASSRKFTFNEIFDGQYYAQRYSVNWASDVTYLHRTTDGPLRLYDLDNSTSDVLVDGETMSKIGGEEYKLSPDKEWILFARNQVPLYRHSFFADYHVYNIKEKLPIKVPVPDKGNDQIRYAGWSSKGNALVIVYKNDIYYSPSARNIAFYRITSDGQDKVLFNGVPDWVYEEEILASTNALKCSPDGRYLAYGKFNASRVPYYKFPRYGPASEAYTTIDKIAYPKAGYANPTVTIYVVDLEAVKKSNGHKTTAVKLLVPDEYRASDHYYSVLQWTSKGETFINWMNRKQDSTMSLVYDPNSGKSRAVENHVVKNGWVDDDYVKPYFAANGAYYITLLPQNVKGKLFRHIAKVQLDNKEGSKAPEFLTYGRWDVGDLQCYDPVGERVFFRSGEDDPSARHLYYVDVDKPRKHICVTCNLDSDCQFYITQMSKKCQWANLMCQGPGIPTTKLRNMKTGQEIILELNQELKESLKSKDLSKTISYTVKSDGFDIPVKEIRPHDFNENKKYPVLFDVYGGPGTQKVQQVFELYFSEFLVSNYDIIVVNTDARGSGMYGDEFKHAIYRRLGYHEARDNINVARALQKKSYIDGSRICVWGWSYGGFLSSTILATGSGVIKCGIAVAPVTDWRYYDTVYTERYMGMPTAEDNLKGYQETSIIPFVKNFTKTNYLLVHGTADDNVHFQNSAQLARALIDNSVQFRTQFYTDNDHGIEGQTNHLYRLLTNFLEAHLKL